MAPTNRPSTSEEARRLGNELYRKGDLSEAENCYKLAAELAPKDVSPLSNLSSVMFEQGQYAAAADYIHQGLEIFDTNSANNSSPDEDAAQQKKRNMLNQRLVKCLVHQRKFAEAEQLAGVSCQSALAALYAWETSCDEAQQWRNVLDRLNIYKGQLDQVYEYFAIGHDHAESLVDAQLLASSSSQDSLSIFFCGSGDARNVFATLFQLQFESRKSQTPKFSHVHFTLLDLKPAAIARTVLFLDIFLTYGMLPRDGLEGREDFPTIMAYLYAGHVIPPGVSVKLQRQIKMILSTLEKEDATIFDWLFVDSGTRQKVVYVLKQWQTPLAHHASYLRTNMVRKVLRQRLSSWKPYHASKGMEDDRKVFDELAIILPTSDFAGRHDPGLVPLMRAYRQGTPRSAEALGDYIDMHWVTNPTIVDVDFTRANEIHCLTEEGKVPYFQDDALIIAVSLVWRVYPNENRSVLECLATYFDLVASSTVKLMDRIMMECLVGEMFEVLERIRWNCLESRSRAYGGIDPSKFPTKYDRIHMSNVPDYVGGPLTAALCGRPLLNEDKTSNLRFCVLSNRFACAYYEHLQSEHLLMYRDEDVTNHFALKRQLPADTTAPLTDHYIVWDRVPAQKLPLNKTKGGGRGLLPRPALEKWLYAHFLKLCLPFPRSRTPPPGRTVFAPLNLTAFLRLVAQLSNIGYPAHWLAGVLEALCSGEITTTARAPRQIVTSPADVDAVHPARKMIVAPWRADFTTNLAIWSRLLPFGFSAPIVGPVDVGQYSVSFPPFPQRDYRSPHFALVLWDSAAAKGASPSPPTAPGGLRRLLLDDEMGDMSELAAGKRRSGAIHVFSSFEWSTESLTARWWCRMDVMKSVLGTGAGVENKGKDSGNWKAFIWRTDSWEKVTPGVDMNPGVIRLLRRWSNGRVSEH